MKIAIVHKIGSFSDRWENYCKCNGIDYKLIEIYKNDIIQQLEDCEAFMWHFSQSNYKDMQFAKALLFSLEKAGKRVFPDSDTCWHFDNKVYQKYLLESINAPLVPSYVFYSKKEALDWAEKTDFPKVFKLKGGAGSSNVKLAKTKNEALKLINKAFGKGFRQYRSLDHYKEEYRKYLLGKSTIKDLLRPWYYALKHYPTEFDHFHGREIGYVYFQDFIPDNKFDIRVCVVGDKAFGLKRMVRNHDFRASGSGNIIYDKSQIDERCVKIAFDVNKIINAQSIAFDFVFDETNTPLIVEISYGYAVSAYDLCEGYWTKDMLWHEGTHFDFCGWMVENLINNV
jgi:RimK-like ATP-grasp domain.